MHQKQLQINVEAPPNHHNNYQLPLDSPTSPRPNSTVDAVALILSKIIESNERYLQTQSAQSIQKKYPKLILCFNYKYQQEIDYERLRKIIFNFCYRTRMRNETLVGAIVYLDRIVQKSNIIICKQNCMLVLACTLLICQKMYDDYHYSVKDYSKVFSIPMACLSKAEHAYLKLIRYDLVVNPDEYNQYRDYIVQKYDATLRQAFPMSGNASLINGFVLKGGLTSVRDVGNLLQSMQGTKGITIGDQAPESNEIQEISAEIVQQGMKTDMKLDENERTLGDISGIVLPGTRF